jgi:hypothetical protein
MLSKDWGSNFDTGISPTQLAHASTRSVKSGIFARVGNVAMSDSNTRKIDVNF